MTIKLWISLCQLGSKQHNVYYVTSSNDFKLCDFNIFYLDSYGDGSVIYNILSHDIPSSFLAYQDLCTYVLLVLTFSSPSKQRKTNLCFSLCLIDKSSLCNSLFYNITWTCTVICMRVTWVNCIICKRIIASLNRLVHWKVGFQTPQ